MEEEKIQISSKASESPEERAELRFGKRLDKYKRQLGCFRSWNSHREWTHERCVMRRGFREMTSTCILGYGAQVIGNERLNKPYALIT